MVIHNVTFLSLMELRSSESDFLDGLLFPEEDIMGCKRFQIFDEFTTSLASCNSYTVIHYTQIQKGQLFFTDSLGCFAYEIRYSMKFEML